MTEKTARIIQCKNCHNFEVTLYKLEDGSIYCETCLEKKDDDVNYDGEQMEIKL